ncbi:HAD hydrolase-like protein [Leeia sp.]|uniref:HAD hydrolase-like protein n=1 Tax=Leeia sp. TaxID=2884678 RepID=UPI0035ADA83D
MAHLLFDLDGTLTDPFEGITRSVQYAMQQLGFSAPPQAELGWVIGPPLRKSFPQLLGRDDLTEAAIAAYRERYNQTGLFENQVYAGIPQALDQLTALGHTLYVVTAKPQQPAERILQYFGLAARFRAISGAALDASLDDKAVQIERLTTRLQLPLQDCLMIGDRDNDLLAARRAGVHALAVCWGYGSDAELHAAQPDGFCRQPDQLPDCITTLLAARLPA